MALREGIIRLLKAFAQAFDVMPGSHDADDEVKALLEGTITHYQVAQGTAGSANSEMFFYAKRAMKILEVTIHPNGALTANDTNYKTASLMKMDGAAGSETAVAAITTKITGGSGDWVDKTAIDVPVTAANAYLTAGQCLVWDLAVAAGGVATPLHHVSVDYELI